MHTQITTFAALSRAVSPKFTHKKPQITLSTVLVARSHTAPNSATMLGNRSLTHSGIASTGVRCSLRPPAWSKVGEDSRSAFVRSLLLLPIHQPLRVCVDCGGKQKCKTCIWNP